MEWLPMVGVGIAWASILSTLCHVIRLMPSDKMLAGVFNFYSNPQLVAASILGFSFQIF
jgi:maltose/moltooligosaccharide transporter